MSANINRRSVLLPATFLAVITTFVTSSGWAQSSFNAQSLSGRYSFRMSPAKGFSADAPGDPGGVVNVQRQDLLRVGFFMADGNGNLAGHSIATTDTNSGKTWLVTYDWTGKYVVNSDGTGYFSIDTTFNQVCTDTTVVHAGATPHPSAPGGTPQAGNVVCGSLIPSVEGHEDYAFVLVSPNENILDFIQTNNFPGGAKILLSGTARKPTPAATSASCVANDDDKGNNGRGGGNGKSDD